MSRLSMRKISEILRQRHELKRTYRDIAQSLNISVGTVKNYLSYASVANISWPLPFPMSEQELHNKLFLPATSSREERPLPNWENVQKEYLKKGMTLRLLWREYRDIHENGLGYTQFCERYNDYKKTIEPVMRQVHKAGEKTFVDYAGKTVEWINTVTGEICDAQIFVGALGASQFIFCEATETQGLPDWVSSHTRMFDYFGGVTEIVVPDNLLSAVTKAHRYDPDINANYQHLSEHYGFAIVPARVREPKDKAKVENAVGIITRQILSSIRHITFTSITEINEAIKPLLLKLNNQQFQKMKTSRRELFETIDKPALKPLPNARYYFENWINAKIHIDYHFVFDYHFYSVPYKHLHHEVQIRATAKTVECFHDGVRIASHVRNYVRYGFTTIKDHMPPAHRAQSEWGSERMKRWAKKIGINTSEFIEVMMASRPFKEQSYRACLGLLRFSTRYGEDRLERACSIALNAGCTRYKQVESILKKQLDKIPTDEKPELILPAHNNIRGKDYYR